MGVQRVGHSVGRAARADPDGNFLLQLLELRVEEVAGDHLVHQAVAAADNHTVGRVHVERLHHFNSVPTVLCRHNLELELAQLQHWDDHCTDQPPRLAAAAHGVVEHGDVPVLYLVKGIAVCLGVPEDLPPGRLVLSQTLKEGRAPLHHFVRLGIVRLVLVAFGVGVCSEKHFVVVLIVVEGLKVIFICTLDGELIGIPRGVQSRRHGCRELCPVLGGPSEGLGFLCLACCVRHSWHHCDGWPYAGLTVLGNVGGVGHRRLLRL
mmetsp:Transcript_35390/g.92581  ORF Transcript_35390/g.92581 Transcript_35390/m.92581 type:complete len:264 (-) Transcript_35390:87-878(-)